MLLKAIVYKSTGSWYRVKTGEGNFIDARIRGKFKTDGLTSTNPVAVGDVVDVEGEGTDVVITNIHDRKNYMIRQSPQKKRMQHIIAANLDQSILMASMKNPKTSPGFIDRFLVAAEAYHVPALILFNKSDLYRDKEMKKFNELKECYEGIGYSVILTSIENQTGMEDLHQLLKGRQTLISGHSGVGKSSLINQLLPQSEIKTQDVSGWSGKGLHTTTFAEMYDLPSGGTIIDTPGMREFALMEMAPVELSHYFKEMKPLIGKCRFNNCLHTEEPDCAVKTAVAEGTVNVDRYISYLNILGSLEEIKY